MQYPRGQFQALFFFSLHAIKFSQPLHFADDTCLLNIQSKISKIKKSLNKDFKELFFWLNVNKIALNDAKRGYTLQI